MVSCLVEWQRSTYLALVPGSIPGISEASFVLHLITSAPSALNLCRAEDAKDQAVHHLEVGGLATYFNVYMNKLGHWVFVR